MVATPPMSAPVRARPPEVVAVLGTMGRLVAGVGATVTGVVELPVIGVVHPV